MATKTYNGVTHTVVQREGKWLDQRAAEYYDVLNRRMPGGITMIQGSFNASIGASAGTHDGPGAMDLKPKSSTYRTVSGYKTLQRLAREQGGAAWFRQWTNNYHVHVIVIGTKGLPSVAVQQVQAYLAGRDGLVSNLAITGVINTTFEKYKASLVDRTRPYGAFPYPNGTGSAYGVSTPNKPYYSGKVAGRLSLTAIRENIKRIQREVRVTADGLFGTQTKAAVVAFQKKYGLTADGVVGPATWAKMTKV